LPRIQKFHQGRNHAVAFVTINKQPLPLPHYCGISNLPNVASARQILDWMVQQFPVTWLQRLVSNMPHDRLRCHPERSLLATDYFGHWSSTWEVNVSTIMRTWKWVFVNGCECNSLISDVIKFLNSCQDWKNASVCSEVMLKNNDTSGEYRIYG
jgi:hypothetical protein